jgi:hypothetical protein
MPDRRVGPRACPALDSTAVSLPLRSRVEHASVPFVTWLNRMPRWLAFLVVLGTMTAGVFVPRVGFVFTLLVAVFLCWLAFLTWPRLTPPEKLMRTAVLALVVAVAIIQAFPR